MEKQEHVLNFECTIPEATQYQIVALIKEVLELDSTIITDADFIAYN